jgi:hypothetical protein
VVVADLVHAHRRRGRGAVSRAMHGPARRWGLAVVMSAWAATATAAQAQTTASAPAGSQGPATAAAPAQPPADTPAGKPASDAGDLSVQATDPTASLMSFNFIGAFATSYHGIDDSGTTLKLQPVVPFRAFGVSNILRVVVPYQVDGPGDEGLKSVTIFDLAVLPQKWGRLAVGPVMSLSESASGDPSTFAIGPAVGAMKPLSKKLNVGMFTQNLFASDVAITQLQPIAAYQLGHGWALSLGDLQFIYDWERSGWVSVPVGFQIGVVRAIARQPMRFAINPQWNVRNVTGATKGQITFTVTLLAPVK